MDGIFFKRKITIFDIAGIISGVVSILLFNLLPLVDSQANTLDFQMGRAFFTLLGAFLITASLLSMRSSGKRYFHVGEDGIYARFSLKKELKCGYDEIAFVNHGGDTLGVKLKNGKWQTMTLLKNAFELCCAIRKKLPLRQVSEEEKARLISELKLITARRRKDIICLVLLLILNFAGIFACVFMTDEKEFSDFEKNDWLIFALFVAAELIISVLVFAAAVTAGNKTSAIEEKRAALRQSALITALPLGGAVIHTYIDCEYITRVTVFSVSGSQVYFYARSVDKNYNLTTPYESELYSDIEELAPMLEELIEIS